jgi:hypothetical protein
LDWNKEAALQLALKRRSSGVQKKLASLAHDFIAKFDIPSFHDLWPTARRLLPAEKNGPTLHCHNDSPRSYKLCLSFIHSQL